MSPRSRRARKRIDRLLRWGQDLSRLPGGKRQKGMVEAVGVKARGKARQLGGGDVLVGHDAEARAGKEGIEERAALSMASGAMTMS